MYFCNFLVNFNKQQVITRIRWPSFETLDGKIAWRVALILFFFLSSAAFIIEDSRTARP